MNHKDIHPGLILRVKKERREAYGSDTSAQYLVTALKQRDGYSVPWIMCGSLVFKASDFDKIVGFDYATLHMIQGDVVR